VGAIRMNRISVEEAWSDVAPWLAEAVAHDFDAVSLEYIRSTVFAGTNVLWLVEDDAGEAVGAAVTIFEHLPNGKKVLGILAAGGDGAIRHLDKWERLMDVLDAYGYSEGASELRIVGRAAFKKLFASSGFTHRYTVLGRKIERRN